LALISLKNTSPIGDSRTGLNFILCRTGAFDSKEGREEKRREEKRREEKRREEKRREEKRREEEGKNPKEKKEKKEKEKKSTLLPLTITLVELCVFFF
jgi:hypothetical protein